MVTDVKEEFTASEEAHRRGIKTQAKQPQNNPKTTPYVYVDEYVDEYVDVDEREREHTRTQEVKSYLTFIDYLETHTPFIAENMELPTLDESLILKNCVNLKRNIKNNSLLLGIIY